VGSVVTSVGFAVFREYHMIKSAVGWVVGCVVIIVFAVKPGRYNESALEAALEAFHSALKFPSESDVRCAIWVPVKGGSTMEQITPYMPGRKPGKGKRLPTSKGIAGNAYRRKKHTRVTLTDRAKDSEGFQNEMVDRWGFTKEEAYRLAQDRRAYYALVIKDDKEEVIGVLYCDSNDASAFPVPAVTERAEELVAFFDELIKLKGV
jgi:hypothetical protein